MHVDVQSFETLKMPSSNIKWLQANKQASIHVYMCMCNAVSLVWGSLRLAPISIAFIANIFMSYVQILCLQSYPQRVLCTDRGSSEQHFLSRVVGSYLNFVKRSNQIVEDIFVLKT